MNLVLELSEATEGGNFHSVGICSCQAICNTALCMQVFTNVLEFASGADIGAMDSTKNTVSATIITKVIIKHHNSLH